MTKRRQPGISSLRLCGESYTEIRHVAKQQATADVGATSPSASATTTNGSKPKRKLRKMQVDSWKPTTIGDTLAGFYVRQEAWKKTGGGTFPVYVIQNEDTGELRAVFGKSLDTNFAQFKFGTYVEVTYMGTKAGNFPSPAKLFDVAYDESVELNPITTDDEVEIDEDGVVIEN